MAAMIRDIFRQGTEKPYLVDPDFVGPKMALEVVEAFYKADVTHRYYCRVLSEDQIFDYRSPFSLKNMIVNDPFNLGFNPAAHLRSLSIEGQMGRLRTTTHTEQGIRESLSLLARIVKKKEFTLSGTSHQNKIRLNMWRLWIEGLHPVLKEFNKAGARVYLH